MKAGGGGEASSCQPQNLTGTSKGSKGGAHCDCHRNSWAGRSDTEFHAKMDVPSREKLDVEDVERGGTYLGMRGLHTRDKTTIFIKSGNKGTKNDYIPLDGTGRNRWRGGQGEF